MTVCAKTVNNRSKITFADKLSPEYIILDLKGDTKEAVIRELGDYIKDNENMLNFDKFLSDVFDREEKASTGIGNGVGFPHARTKNVKDFIVAIGRKSPGIEFDAIDKKPVEIVILMGIPLSKINLYLKLLAHLSYLLKRPGFVEGLKSAENPEAVIHLFQRYEKKPDNPA